VTAALSAQDIATAIRTGRWNHAELSLFIAAVGSQAQALVGTHSGADVVVEHLDNACDAMNGVYALDYEARREIARETAADLAFEDRRTAA
jgi:hypothetical protein